jgi:sigma-E factor negative regulatory protein RseA
MSEEIDNQLSRFADGDLDRERASFLVHRLSQDPRLKAKWSRLHLLGATLRQQSQPTLRPDFASRVMARLDEPESAPAMMAPAARQRWLRPVAGMALAASVTAAMVGGVWFARTSPESQQVAATPTPPSPAREPRRSVESQLMQPIPTQSAVAGNGASTPQLASVGFGSELSAYLVQRRVGTVYVNGQPTPIVVVRRPQEANPSPATNPNMGQLVSERR